MVFFQILTKLLNLKKIVQSEINNSIHVADLIKTINFDLNILQTNQKKKNY